MIQIFLLIIYQFSLIIINSYRLKQLGEMDKNINLIIGIIPIAMCIIGALK